MINAEYDLQELHAATNKAVKSAIRMRRLFDGPINWGDLKCFQTEKWTDSYGETGYRVWIDEAEPGCSNDKFCAYIRKKLEKAGFCGIDVQTEW